MIRTLFVFVLAFLGASACGRRADVSCVVERLGMCHEWLERTAIERRELNEAVCKKSDERFSESLCPPHRRSWNVRDAEDA